MPCPQCIRISNGDVIFDLLIKVGFLHHKFTNNFPLKLVSINMGTQVYVKHYIPHHNPQF